ncbi:MAG: hypothetical protein ACKVS6_02065 [Planctomycetota bacterium]
MGLESLNRVGASSRNVDGPSARPNGASEPARPSLQNGGRDADVIDINTVHNVASTFSRHQERLERAIESRRKLVEALREVMNSGGLDTPEAAGRAADGILRRGSVG